MVAPAEHPPIAEKFYAGFTVLAGALLLSLIGIDFCFYEAQSFSSFGFDPAGYAVGRDFLNTWMGGRSAFSGGPAPWFDYTIYNSALQTITGHPDYPLHFWSYPPHLILFTWPLGLLPYLPAYLAWCCAGLALYVLAARTGGVSRNQFLFLAVAPGVTINVFYGQNGFLTAALLIGGFHLRERRPIVSGILFGLLTVKPQLGLMLPVMLLVTGRWRVIIAAAATAAVLAGLTAIWFGADIWLEFFRKVVPQQQWLLIAGGDRGWPLLSSAYLNARLVGLPDRWAWTLQALSSGCALAMVVWTFWRRRDPALSFALLVTATFLATPYIYNYDMVVFGFVVALLRERGDNSLADHALALALWTLPVTMLVLGLQHVPIAMLVLPAFAARLLWRLSRAQSVHEAVAGALPGALERLAVPH